MAIQDAPFAVWLARQVQQEPHAALRPANASGIDKRTLTILTEDRRG